MDSFNYDCYCGIYCGACDILMTYKTGYKHRPASFWNESTVKTLHNKLGLYYDKNRPFTTKCNGCKSDTLFVNCAVCEIRKCNNCGKDLKEYSFSFSFFQAMILKSGIYTLSRRRK